MTVHFVVGSITGALARGLKVSTGRIVEATIIGVPSSTKNANKARDSRKGQQRFFDVTLPSA